MGFVKGTIKVGDEIVVTKMSCVTETPVKTTVLSLMVPEGEVQEVSDRMVMARVQDGAKLDIYRERCCIRKMLRMNNDIMLILLRWESLCE